LNSRNREPLVVENGSLVANLSQRAMAMSADAAHNQSASWPSRSMPDATFRAAYGRARRATIDDAPCNATIRMGFELTVREAGSYLVEALLSHALGADLNHLAHRSLVVVGSAAMAAVPPAAAVPPLAAVPLVPQCSPRGDHPGRWVRPSELPGCSGMATPPLRHVGDDGAGAQLDAAAAPPHCAAANATLGLVDDEMRYNRGYVWQPDGCFYRPYDAQAIAQCASTCGYGSIGFAGDSLGREPLANLLQIIGNASAVDGRAINTDTSTMISVRLPSLSDHRGGAPWWGPQQPREGAAAAGLAPSSSCFGTKGCMGRARPRSPMCL
jgi:hypothetical protein